MFAKYITLALFQKKFGDVLPSQDVSIQVLLALKVLTAVFGMGTGGTPSLSSPKFVEYVLFHTFTTAYYPFSLSLKSDSNLLWFTKDLLFVLLKLINFTMIYSVIIFVIKLSTISIGQLHTLLHFHTRPINLLV